MINLVTFGYSLDQKIMPLSDHIGAEVTQQLS